MESLPLSILAFSAGVYLLIKVKKEYLSSMFNVLAWFVTLASLVSIGVASVECWEEYFEDGCDHDCEYRVEKKIIMHDGEVGKCHHLGKSTCGMSDCGMAGCKMEGDSCIMEKEACEKLMGKEACDKMAAERGRCIMSQEECIKMCHPKGGMQGCHSGMKGNNTKCSGTSKGSCSHHRE